VDFEQTRRAEEEHPVLLSHCAKYRSLMPSLALLGPLIEGFVGFVGWSSPRVHFLARSVVGAWGLRLRPVPATRS